MAPRSRNSAVQVVLLGSGDAAEAGGDTTVVAVLSVPAYGFAAHKGWQQTLGVDTRRAHQHACCGHKDTVRQMGPVRS